MKHTLLIFGLLAFSFSISLAQHFISADSLKNHVYTLADDAFEGRSIGAKGGDKAAQYIVSQFESIGIKPLLSDYYHRFTYYSGAMSAEGKNIIGIIEGSNPDLKNEYIVIGGHYDHVGYYFKDGEKIVYNGADDNASGVAGVIEIARAIYTNQSLFERSIILVAFDGEETGLNGSKWFVNDSLIPAAQIKLMMSIDMIGMLSKNKGVELYGTGSFKDASLITKQIAEKNNLSIKKDVKAVSARTDTKSFADAGIPAIHVFTGTVSPYHKPEDDSDLLDYEGMAQISDFIYDFTLKMAETESAQMISTLPTNGKPPIFKFGVRFNAGTSHLNYPDQFYRAKSSMGIQTGLYAHINVTERFALQPELLYETLGSTHVDGNFRTHAITTPVNVLFRLAGNYDYNTWSYLVIGGYYTHNFAGKIGNETINYSTEYEQNDYGLNVGLAINISKVQIGITQKYGLTNLYKDATVNNANYNALFFTVGIQF